MECNIDQKGRLARLYTGIFAIAVGIAIALLTYLSVIPAALGWIAVAGSVFGGARLPFSKHVKAGALYERLVSKLLYDASTSETFASFGINFST